MSTEPLFALSLEERRKAFVRARFGQNDVFGREDFENLVDVLATATNLRDLDTKTLQLLLRLINYGKQPTDLHNYATPFTTIDLDWISLDWIERPVYMRDAARQTFERLVPRDGTQVFWGCKNVLALLYTPNESGFCHYGFIRAYPHSERLPHFPYEALLLLAIENIDIVEVIFAEWYRGWPKAEAARKHCVARLRGQIRIEREKAERDFDSAVAVSADGKKIVHASEVWVGKFIENKGWRHEKTIIGALCTDKKILRLDGDLERYPDMGSVCEWGVPTHKQCLVPHHQFNKIMNTFGNIFFTTPDLCPPELLALAQAQS